MDRKSAKEAKKPLHVPGWFTLAELIVVIAILVILSAVGVIALQGYSQDAKEAKARTNVRSVLSAISSEAAAANQSPRHYVVHDPAAALPDGASAYVDGRSVALTGGQHGAPGTNYSAGNPDWVKLKLDPVKFGGPWSGPGTPVVGALDAEIVSTVSGRKRTASFSQAAVLLDDRWTAVVAGDFPVPGTGGPGGGAVGWLLKDPASPSSTGAIVDGGRNAWGWSGPVPASWGWSPVPAGTLTIGNAFNFSGFPARLNFSLDSVEGDGEGAILTRDNPFVFEATFSASGLDPSKTYFAYVGTESCSKGNVDFYYESPWITGVSEYSETFPIEVSLASGYQKQPWGTYLTDAATTHQCQVMLEIWEDSEDEDAPYETMVVQAPEFELYNFYLRGRWMSFMSWSPFNFGYTHYSEFGDIFFRHKPNSQYVLRFVEDPANPCQKNGVTCVLPWDAAFTTDASGVYEGNVYEWTSSWSISYPEFYGATRSVPFGGEFQILEAGQVVASHVVEMDLNFSEPY